MKMSPIKNKQNYVQKRTYYKTLTLSTISITTITMSTTTKTKIIVFSQEKNYMLFFFSLYKRNTKTVHTQEVKVPNQVTLYLIYTNETCGGQYEKMTYLENKTKQKIYIA